MARPKLVQATEEDEVYDFDHYLEEAAASVKMFKLRLPVFEPEVGEDGSPVLDEDGEPKLKRTGVEVVEVPPPSKRDMEQVTEAQREQDANKLADAVFDVHAQRVIDLTDDADYFVINKMVNDVMRHYGRRLEDLGES
jgi:hypothetical protein